MYDKVIFFFKDPGTLGGEGEVIREKAWNNHHPSLKVRDGKWCLSPGQG